MTRALLLASLLAGCTLDEPGAGQDLDAGTFEARTEILEVSCQRFGNDRIQLTGTFDVALDVGQAFTVDQYAAIHLGTSQTTYACGNWQARSSTPEHAADAGCDRIADMPDAELITLTRDIELVGSIIPRTIELDVQARAVGRGGETAISDIARVACDVR